MTQGGVGMPPDVSYALIFLTGMRLGEVLALKRADVFPDHVHVAHSWSAKYGRGRTKTKRVDDVVIPRQVHEMILSWCTWEGFVFSFSNGQRPCSGNRLAEAFPKAMRAQGIPTVDEHGRPRTFHGWRNFANSYFLARGISGEKTRQIIRHETDEMTQHYATGFRLEDWKDVAAAQEQLVGPLALTGGTEDRA